MAKILWSLMHQLGGFTAGLPILLELQQRGHDIVVLSQRAAEERVADFGFGFRADQHVPPYDWSRPETVPARLDNLSWGSYRQLLLDPIPDQFADAAAVLDAEPVDLLIADGMNYGAGLAAESRKVPWACYVPFAFDESVYYGDREARAQLRQWNGTRASLGLADDPRPVSEAPWLCFSRFLTLILGLPDLAFRRFDLPGYFVRVGPVAWDPTPGFEPPAWFADLGRDRPMVLLAMSSTWVDEAALVSATAEALAAEDIDVVATVPADHPFPAVPANVRLCRFFPHGLLVPKASAVVCSGGYGVVTRAACAAVPTVVVPYGGDGNCVALAAAKSGFAIALDPERMSVGGLRSAVLAALGDAKYRDRAAELARTAAAFNGPVAAADALERLLPRPTGC